MGVDIHIFLEHKPETEKEYKIIQLFNKEGFVEPFDERNSELFNILQNDFSVRGFPVDVSPEVREKYTEGLDEKSGVNFYYGVTYIYFDELLNYLKEHRPITFYNEETNQWDREISPLFYFYERLYFYMCFAWSTWLTYNDLDFRNTRIVFWFDH